MESSYLFLFNIDGTYPTIEELTWSMQGKVQPWHGNVTRAGIGWADMSNPGFTVEVIKLHYDVYINLLLRTLAHYFPVVCCSYIMHCFFPNCDAPETAVKLVAVMLICKLSIAVDD